MHSFMLGTYKVKRRNIWLRSHKLDRAITFFDRNNVFSLHHYCYKWLCVHKLMGNRQPWSIARHVAILVELLFSVGYKLTSEYYSAWREVRHSRHSLSYCLAINFNCNSESSGLSEVSVSTLRILHYLLAYCSQFHIIFFGRLREICWCKPYTLCCLDSLEYCRFCTMRLFVSAQAIILVMKST